jgi:hypothetical protein
VGDAIFDNLTGRDDANKMLYQYSLDDYYAGFALLTPESEPCYYGNYNNWFLDGTDAEVDSVVAIPTYEDSLEIIPGDHSCYMVVEMGELPALTSKTVAFAFAVNEDLPSLQNSIMQAKELYVEYINTISTYPVAREYSLFLAYPNPFNVNIIINLDLTQASGGELTVFNVLGKPVSTIYRGYLNSGGHKFEWNGMDANGIRVSAGVYYLSSHFSNTNEIRKIVFLP